MKIKDIPQKVIAPSLVSFFTDVASEMLYPVMPLFLISVLGGSMALLGSLEGIAAVVSGLLKGYFGALSDKLQKRKLFVIIGYSLSAVVKPLPGIVQTIPMTIFSRISDRVGKGIRTAPRDALLASYGDKKNSGAIFGFHRAMDTLGAALGPIVALLILQHHPGNYSTVFYVAIIPSLFAIALTFTIKENVIKKEGKKRSESFVTFWKKAPTSYKRYFYLLVLFSLANSSDVFLIVKSKEISGSETTSIIAYILYNLVFAFASFPLGKLSDKVGKTVILGVGFLVFSIVYFGLGVTSSIEILFLLFIIYGIYAASTDGISKALISDLITDELRGTAIGLLVMCMSFAEMTGSIITGVLWDFLNPQAPFIFSATVSLFVGASFLFLNRNYKNNF